MEEISETSSWSTIDKTVFNKRSAIGHNNNWKYWINVTVLSLREGYSLFSLLATNNFENPRLWVK